MDAPRIPTQCRHYLDHLSLPEAERHALEAQLDKSATFSTRVAMEDLHHALAGEHANPDNPALGSVLARTWLALAPKTADKAQLPPAAVLCDDAGTPLSIAPPINRASMVPEPWGALNPLTRWLQGLFKRQPKPLSG